MAEDAKILLSKYEKEDKNEAYYLKFYRELNESQEKRYVDFAKDRWSIEQFLGYQQLIKSATVINTDDD